MTEQELRQLVRGVLAERVRLKPDTTPPPSGESPSWCPPSGEPSTWCPPSGGPYGSAPHASHALFVIPAQGDACIIEPSVACNHCGYCKSYGH